MLLFTLLACSPDLEESDTETDDPGPVRILFQIVESSDPGDGFGSSLAWGNSLLVGAPRGPLGKVYAIESETPVLFFEEASPGAAGTSLAWDASGEALIGAPLAGNGLGRVYRVGGQTQTGGNLFGARIHTTKQGVMISESGGFWMGEAFFDVQGRVGDLALWGDTAVVGHPSGTSVLSGLSQTYARVEPLDEAGTALCVANFDDDPEDELAIGAPGSGWVSILNPGDTLADAFRIGTGSGRFGQAIACRDHFLVVGAPMHGSDLSGAGWCFQGPMSEWNLGAPLQVGDPWQQLGAAVAVSTQGLAMGAPGTALVPGSVRIGRFIRD